MKKILVLAEHYVKDGNYSLLYVHTRNIQYIEKGYEIIVLNFSEKENYVIDGVKVYGESSFYRHNALDEFDIILSHAPNLKNHFRFLLKNFRYISNIIFFIHGHEVLIKDKFYPKPFPYEKKRILRFSIHFIYDRIKVLILKSLFSFFKRRKNLHFVFVSQWMISECVKSIGLSHNFFKSCSSIIHNSINPVFLERSYKESGEISGDFICIRPFDGPKYCVDLYCELALRNPSKTFTLYGKGEFFNYNSTPKNLVIHEHYLDHKEIPDILNKHKAAIMLSRLDAQGVMACELATYGIALVTSDIPVKREMLSGAKNVYFMPNDLSLKLSDFALEASRPLSLIEKFGEDATILREIELFKNL